jgi:hypothetical protein
MVCVAVNGLPVLGQFFINLSQLVVFPVFRFRISSGSRFNRVRVADPGRPKGP